jgi:hypothetical protein
VAVATTGRLTTVVAAAVAAATTTTEATIGKRKAVAALATRTPTPATRRGEELVTAGLQEEEVEADSPEEASTIGTNLAACARETAPTNSV